MLSEGRKRDTAANALLALSFAANAAQSPKDLVRSGHVEGPGVQLMSRMMTKRKEADRNLDSGRVSHPARNRKMKTFREFLEECEFIEESSSGERSGKRTRGKVTLARGRGADMDRSERSTAAIAKKAGLKGTGKYSTKDLRSKPKDYTTYDSEDSEDDVGSTEQDHYIRTHSSARKAAKGERLISKMKAAGRSATGMTKHKTAPSKESVRRVKDLKKQMTKAGSNKRGAVHTVDIMHRDSNVGKGDKNQQMERGRNFIQAVKDTPHHLKAAGAKKGDTVIGKPTAVMGGEDKKTGEAKRAKLYKKVFGKKSTEKSAKTGLMVGKVDEAYKRYPAKKVGNKLDRMYDDPDTDTRLGKDAKRYSKMMRVDSHMRGEVLRSDKREYSPKLSKAKEAENRKKGSNV